MDTVIKDESDVIPDTNQTPVSHEKIQDTTGVDSDSIFGEKEEQASMEEGHEAVDSQEESSNTKEEDLIGTFSDETADTQPKQSIRGWKIIVVISLTMLLLIMGGVVYYRKKRKSSV